MTTPIYHEIKALALLMPCRYCGAVSRGPCRRKSGRTFGALHATREQRVWALYLRGYDDGRKDAVSMSS